MRREDSKKDCDHPVIQKKIRKSLELSIKEGSAASASNSFGLSYLSPFALAMNASSSQIGILNAVIHLLPSLVQIKSAALIRRFSRKKIVLNGVLWKILIWIPIILTGVLFYMGVPHMAWVLVGLIGLLYTFAAVVNPAWFSWMGSLVPEEERGQYFSNRNRISGFFGVITMVLGAVILDGIKGIGEKNGNILGYTLLGFGLLFTIAAIMQTWSWLLLKRQYEPKLSVRKKDYFSFWDFIRGARSNSFGKFVLFRGVFSFAIAIASPFWVVYMLRDLGFSYIWYMAITVAGILFQMAFLPLLGKMSDSFGNVKVTSFCSWAISLVPIAWIVPSLMSNGFYIKFYLLIVPSILGGFGWAGYNLAVNNYVYDAVSYRKQSFGLSYMNLVVGISLFMGASIGSFLAWLNVSFMNPLLFIFAVSALARLMVSWFGLGVLNEVRHVKKFSSNYIIKEFQPVRGVVREIHNLEFLVKRVSHYN
jgi:MFS family permease